MSLIIDRRDGLLILTIDRPQHRNALTMEVMAGLGAAMAEAEDDPAVRCVVLTGAGDKAFCAGMDLKAFAGGGVDVESGRTGMEIFTHRVYPKPIIGAINGLAVGGGFELMLACDLVVASETAVFGTPEAKVGFLPPMASLLLPGRIPLAVALELAMTGDLIDAARAKELGLVNRVVPAAQVMEAALALAGTVAANAPLALAAIKRLALTEITERRWAEVSEVIAPVFLSEDAKEGARAFAEKRRPTWTGR
jgi:enoyl-CoA hydratase